MSLNESEFSHSVKPPEQACQSCHGKDMNKEFVGRPTRYLLGQVRASMLKKILDSAVTLKVLKAFDAATDKDSELMLNGRTIVGLENVTTVHGQLALVVKLSDSTVVTSLISEFREAPAPDGKQIFPTAHLVVREAII